MSIKCVHKGCGKLFDPSSTSEECNYHPGPPEFHEGQKGWKCCKPRTLTFDEFMAIPPCTTGSHSATEDSVTDSKPNVQEANEAASAALQAMAIKAQSQSSAATETVTMTSKAMPKAPRQSGSPTAPPPPEDESDDPDTIPLEATGCKRKGCDVTYRSGANDSPACVYHPGQPIFHEGSKGYTCCKRRVLEFDEFLKIAGCKEKSRHCFVGKKKDPNLVEQLSNVRHDFYQTGNTVIASLYLKKVDKASSTIKFTSSQSIDVDLRTTDSKSYHQSIPLHAPIDTQKSTHKIMGTKVEFNLVKADGTNWAVFRSDDRPTGEIIQTGRAARVCCDFLNIQAPYCIHPHR